MQDTRLTSLSLYQHGFDNTGGAARKYIKGTLETFPSQLENYQSFADDIERSSGTEEVGNVRRVNRMSVWPMSWESSYRKPQPARQKWCQSHQLNKKEVSTPDAF